MTYTPLPHARPHLAKAELGCADAGLVDLVHRSGRERVLLLRQGSASLHQLFALREAGDGRVVLGLVDDLEPVRVVVGHDGVEGHLGEDVDAAVDDADRVELERDRGRDPRRLAGEEVGKRWAVVAAVGLGPDGELVSSGLVCRESRAGIMWLVRSSDDAVVVEDIR